MRAAFLKTAHMYFNYRICFGFGFAKRRSLRGWQPPLRSQLWLSLPLCFVLLVRFFLFEQIVGKRGNTKCRNAHYRSQSAPVACITCIGYLRLRHSNRHGLTFILDIRVRCYLNAVTIQRFKYNKFRGLCDAACVKGKGNRDFTVWLFRCKGNL